MNFDAWRCYLRGRLWSLLRQPRRAEAEYREALRHAPDNARLWHTLGFLLASQQLFREAAPCLERAADITPRDSDLWFNLGYIRQKLGDADGAIAAFERSVAERATQDRAWFGLGMLHAGAGRHEQARDALTQAAELQPMNGEAWYQLGMAHHTLHDTDRVKEIALHLNRFDRLRTRQLIRDTQRNDLAWMVQDLLV